MAAITVIGFSKPFLDQITDPRRRYMVHLDFVPPITFKQYKDAGFNAEEWEKRNYPNEVRVKENVSAKQFIRPTQESKLI